MALTVQWIGHASFRIASDETTIYIDPWKIVSPQPNADVIFISHGHYDHCSQIK